jgi:hypothetical protein
MSKQRYSPEFKDEAVRQVQAVWRVLSTSVQASTAGPSWEDRVEKDTLGNKTA